MTSGHENFKGQLPAYLLGALEPGERADLEHHLDVVARPSMLDGGALFEPGSGRMRAALTAS